MHLWKLLTVSENLILLNTLFQNLESIRLMGAFLELSVDAFGAGIIVDGSLTPKSCIFHFDMFISGFIANGTRN